MIEQQRLEVVDRIVLKGGLMGALAMMYRNDSEKSNQFLHECLEQCRNKMLWDFWGRDLIFALISYRLVYLRNAFTELYGEQLHIPASQLNENRT